MIMQKQRLPTDLNQYCVWVLGCAFTGAVYVAEARNPTQQVSVFFNN